MRQLARGVLAALVLMVAACGDGNDDAAATATASARPVPATDLAASSRPGARTTVVGQGGSFTIAVTSPEGIDAAGLDAAVSVLMGRPDTNVAVVAPATDVRADPEGRSPTTVAPVDGTTMTGTPASVVNGTMLDAVDSLLVGSARPDLVVIGLTDDRADTSAAIVAARAVAAAGLPVIVVSVGGDDPDLAGAALLLASIADYELDALLDEPAVHVLTVPACDAGFVRGPVFVDTAPSDSAPPSPDCTSPDVGPFDDEHEAWSAGHATVATRNPAAP